MLEDLTVFVVRDCIGENDYSFGFKIFNASHLDVYRITEAGVYTNFTLNSDYTVAGQAGKFESGGTITTTSTFSDGKIYIGRKVPLKQQAHFPDTGRFPAKPVEEQFDKMVMMIQTINEAFTKSIHAPMADGQVDMELPPIADRAVGGFLYFREGDGKPITVSDLVLTPVSTFWQAILLTSTVEEAQDILDITDRNELNRRLTAYFGQSSNVVHGLRAIKGTGNTITIPEGVSVIRVGNDYRIITRTLIEENIIPDVYTGDNSTVHYVKLGWTIGTETSYLTIDTTAPNTAQEIELARFITVAGDIPPDLNYYHRHQNATFEPEISRFRRDIETTGGNIISYPREGIELSSIKSLGVAPADAISYILIAKEPGIDNKAKDTAGTLFGVRSDSTSKDGESFTAQVSASYDDSDIPSATVNVTTDKLTSIRLVTLIYETVEHVAIELDLPLARDQEIFFQGVSRRNERFSEYLPKLVSSGASSISVFTGGTGQGLLVNNPVVNGRLYATSSGTFIVPPGIYELLVKLGAGGGGGGSSISGNSSPKFGYGGMAGGETKSIINVSPGQSISYTIGSGGGGGGGTGGNTTFSTITVTGGIGGHAPITHETDGDGNPYQNVRYQLNTPGEGSSMGRGGARGGSNGAGAAGLGRSSGGGGAHSVNNARAGGAGTAGYVEVLW